MDAPNLPEFRTVYRALHRPLTVCGVDRRLFFLALLVGAATFNLFYSFLAGCLLFSVLYAFALWSTTHDPQMLQILLRSGDSPHAIRRREARPCHIESQDGRHGERQSHPQGLPRSGQRSTRFSRCGDSSTSHAFLTKAGALGLVYRLAGRGLRMPRPSGAAEHRAPLRAGAPAARRVLPRLSVPHQAAGARRSRRPRTRIRSSTRR